MACVRTSELASADALPSAQYGAGDRDGAQPRETRWPGGARVLGDDGLSPLEENGRPPVALRIGEDVKQTAEAGVGKQDQLAGGPSAGAGGGAAHAPQRAAKVASADAREAVIQAVRTEDIHNPPARCVDLCRVLPHIRLDIIAGAALSEVVGVVLPHAVDGGLVGVKAG